MQSSHLGARGRDRAAIQRTARPCHPRSGTETFGSANLLAEQGRLNRVIDGIWSVGDCRASTTVGSDQLATRAPTAAHDTPRRF